MNKLELRLILGALALVAIAACGDDDGGDDDDMGNIDASMMFDAPPNQPDAGPQNIDVNADITADTTWTYPNTYFLKKHVFVKNATLTIEPGVVIKGEAGTSVVITKTGKINAVGTAALPIVFTSAEATPAPGDWGGLVLLGNAKINDTAGSLTIEGFPPAAGPDVTYGGTDDAHDCGDLVYVRVEYAGFELEQDKELNGISVGACGSGSNFDFIQIHKGSDDGIEFFGGTANIKHLVITDGQDDGLDWDLGWTGKVQFLIVRVGNDQGENGFEGDNHPTAFNSTPRSTPTVFNATVIGPGSPTGKKKNGMIIRVGSGAKLSNVIITGFVTGTAPYSPGLPIDVRNVESVMQTPANLFLKNSIVFNNANQGAWNDGTDNDGNFDEGAYFLAQANNNLTSDPALGDPTNLADPNFQPASNSPALVSANAATPPSDGFFDATATFIGAIGATDWTAGWTAFP